MQQTRVSLMYLLEETENLNDELEGVIDDRDNPYDQTIPITVEILREIVVNYSKDSLK